jgi:hypothetical protein
MHQIIFSSMYIILAKSQLYQNCSIFGIQNISLALLNKTITISMKTILSSKNLDPVISIIGNIQQIV